MESKAVKYSFQGMNRDLSEGKHPAEFFYEANNIRFLTTSEVITGGIAFEKGNEKKVSLPSIEIRNGKSTVVTSTGQNLKYTYGNEIDTQLDSGKLQNLSGNQVIIGHAATRNSLVLFSTDENNMDCIWEVDMSNYNIKLLYVRNLNFSKNNPIQTVYNYENENIQKVYWVDGKNQIRFMNLRHSIANGFLEELIDVNSNTINFVGNFQISQPVIKEVVSGGNHTSGMVQYAYNLYRLNSSQTKLSPLSPLVALSKGKGLGGGKLNEIVGSTPVVEINNLDKEYTHIKVYAIKYTSYNQIPSISLIEDQEIPSNRKVTVFDDGNIKEQMSLEQLLFLGSDPIIPQHIETKDNILFPANIKEKNFDVTIDTRAYSFPVSSATTKVFDGITSTNEFKEAGHIVNTTEFFVPEKHDSINLNFDKYKHLPNSTVLGGEGKYIKYEVIQDNTITNPEDYRFYKDNEVYRFGLSFYNRLGQSSLPKWVADFKMPEGNLEGKYNTIKFTLKPEFYVWLNTASNFASEDDKPVGYRILRANRTLNDRTIITQGFLNGMMSNTHSKIKGDSNTTLKEEHRREAETGEKLPSLQRVYGDHHRQMRKMEHFQFLSKSGNNLDTNEVVTSTGEDGMIANTYQFNSMMQLFSPDTVFGNVNTYEGLSLRIKGANKNKKDYFWGQERRVTTKEILIEGKVLGKLTPADTVSLAEQKNIIGNVDKICDKGILGPSGGEETMDMIQFYRDFTGGFVKSNSEVKEFIYGKPQFTEVGQGATYYNGKSDLKYYNTLQPLLTDNIDDKDRGEHPGITSVNSWGSRCLTLMLGAEGIALRDRTRLEQLFAKMNIAETNVMLVGELVKSDEQIYRGNIYGGNSYEDKKRTKYIEIGEYKHISANTNLIINGGDTFVQNFRFGKIVKTNTEVYNTYSMQVTEIVEGLIETDIDLKNRHDDSLQAWDSKFQPKYEEYHDYNRVYSQEPTLKQESDLDYNFRKIKNFDTRIMATKIKTPGEFIDNWTDLLVNESLDLNGKYGRINALVSFKDNLYAFQDNAFAAIGINPRVQVQGGDGLAIELGTGGILHDYNYVSTTTGCINKWGVIPTSNGIYYLDALNKAILRFTGQSLEGLSATRGLHKYLIDNLNMETLKEDNPFISSGVSMGYDILNSDVYLTHNDSNNIWTLCFNEKQGQFTGFYDYHAPMYVYTKEKLLTLNPNAMGDLYETHAGEYNIFYGENKESSIIFIANPEADHECIFSNLEYKSVALDKNKVEQRYTWEQVRLYNEFQDSGLRDLVARKLNRKYRVALPRHKNSTDRIRNNWAFIELRSNNAQKLFYVNQDIILHYRPNYIVIR